MNETAHIFLEHPVRGTQNYCPLPDSYVENPIFIRLLTLHSHSSQSSFRTTDILCDITSQATWANSDTSVCLPQQKHDYIELIYVYNGTLTIHSGKDIIQIPSGSVFSLNTGISHSIFPNDYDAIFLGLSRNFFKLWSMKYEAKNYQKSIVMEHINRNLLSNHQPSKGYILFHEKVESPLKFLLDQIQNELSQKQPGYSLMLYGLVFRIFMLLEDTNFFENHYENLDVHNKRILTDEITSWMLSHPYRITHAELSAALNYSETYISRVYKHCTGESITTANRRIYLEEAERLLSTTSLSIEYICQKLHFKDRTSFYKIFKEHFGCTPRQYRLSHTDKS